MIAEENGKMICLVKGFGWLLKLLGFMFEKINKAFGNLTYEFEISKYELGYWNYNLVNSIKETEK